MIPKAVALPLIVGIAIAWLPEMFQGIELLHLEKAVTLSLLPSYLRILSLSADGKAAQQEAHYYIFSLFHHVYPLQLL